MSLSASHPPEEGQKRSPRPLLKLSSSPALQKGPNSRKSKTTLKTKFVPKEWPVFAHTSELCSIRQSCQTQTSPNHPSGSTGSIITIQITGSCLPWLCKQMLDFEFLIIPHLASCLTISGVCVMIKIVFGWHSVPLVLVEMFITGFQQL